MRLRSTRCRAKGSTTRNRLRLRGADRGLSRTRSRTSRWPKRQSAASMQAGGRIVSRSVPLQSASSGGGHGRLLDLAVKERFRVARGEIRTPGLLVRSYSTKNFKCFAWCRLTTRKPFFSSLNVPKVYRDCKLDAFEPEIMSRESDIQCGRRFLCGMGCSTRLQACGATAQSKRADTLGP
jgi:hypothetical protein